MDHSVVLVVDLLQALRCHKSGKPTGQRLARTKMDDLFALAESVSNERRLHDALLVVMGEAKPVLIRLRKTARSVVLWAFFLMFGRFMTS